MRKRYGFGDGVEMRRAENDPSRSYSECNSRPNPYGILIEASAAKERKGSDQQRVFEYAGKYSRRDYRGEDPSKHAAERDPKIELGQLFGRRSALRQSCVAQQGAGEEQQKVQSDEYPVQARRRNKACRNERK